MTGSKMVPMLPIYRAQAQEAIEILSASDLEDGAQIRQLMRLRDTKVGYGEPIEWGLVVAARWVIARQQQALRANNWAD